MSIAVSFLVTLAVILGAGAGYRRWDESHHQRFTDEAGTQRAVPSLALIEARRLALHPAFLITLALFAGVTALFMIPEHDATIQADSVEFFTFIALPLGALALVAAAHRNATRSRRDRTDELFASTPTSPRGRTAAFLLACLGPLPIAVAYLAIAQLARELMLDAPLPPLWAALAASFAAILLAVVGGAVVGVFLSRWLPTTAAAVAGIVAIIWLNNGPDNHDPRFRWLRVLVEEDLGGRFDLVPSAGWQLAFIAGLVALGGCLALWRHPAGKPLVISTSLCALVVAGSGWVMSRPPSSVEIERVVAELEGATGHQTCVQRGGVRYCAFPGAEPWIDVWERAVTGVLVGVPAAARPADLQVVQRESVPNLAAPVEFNGSTSYPYLDEVVDSLDPERAWPADGAVHPALEMNDDQPDLEVAFGAAALAVGLPPSSSWDSPRGCMAGGQARLVVATWLAGDATATTRRALASQELRVQDESLHDQHVSLSAVSDYEDSSASRDGYHSVIGASGYGSDIVVAQRLVAQDRDDIAAVVSEHWDELVRASTPTSRLLELTGTSAPEGPSSVTTSAPGACP